MALNLSLQKQKSDNSPNLSNINNYCKLHAQQLIYHYPIYCVRIVYEDPESKTQGEVVQYTQNEHNFSSQNLAYLRSESWLENFPHVFEVNEFKLVELPYYYCYVCVISYKNYKPEYIQIITNEALPIQSQNQLQNSAIILRQYTEIYSENLHQKSEIQLLEHIIHKASHQLRNSLSLIGLYAHNLYLRLSDAYCQQQAMIIHDNLQKLDSNLTEMLCCGQAVKLNIVSQDLRDIVAESINNLQPIINQKQIKIKVPDISETLLLDKLQIQQVFDNLISNAIYFSPDFGKITISWHAFQEEVLIKISDRGPGISPEDMQKIFNPFYSRRPGGTGLGLTIAKKIVLDHRGNLWAQNLPEGGAMFSIILPRK